MFMASICSKHSFELNQPNSRIESKKDHRSHDFDLDLTVAFYLIIYKNWNSLN